MRFLAQRQDLKSFPAVGLRAAGISSIWCHRHVVIMQWVDGLLCRITKPFVEYVSQFFGRRDTEDPQKCHPPFRGSPGWLWKRSAIHVVLAPWIKFVCL